MTINIPEEALGAVRIDPSEGRFEMAVGLYTRQQITLGQAAKIAGVPYVEFMREIGRRGIYLNYSVEDALHDMNVVEKLSRSGEK